MKNDTGQLGVLAEKCAKNLRFPYACGLIEVFGHIRARTCGPTRTRIPPFNLSPRVRAEDFIIIDLDSVQHGTASLLPGQTPSQLEINKSCPDDGSLGGSHAVYPTRFGMSDPPLRPTCFPASIIRDGVPIHPDSWFLVAPERGRALAQNPGPHRVAIMQDIEEMLAITYSPEDNVHRTFISASIGRIDYLSEEAMAMIKPDLLKNRGPYRSVWAMCEGQAEMAFSFDPVNKT